MGARPTGHSATLPIPTAILATREDFIAGYNGQLAVDAANQIIVSHRLVTNSVDVDGLIPPDRCGACDAWA